LKSELKRRKKREWARAIRSTGLEEEDGNLAEVEVDKVLCFMRHVAAKVAADDAVPCRVILLVELLLDVRRNVLFNVVLFERLSRTFSGQYPNLKGLPIKLFVLDFHRSGAHRHK